MSALIPALIQLFIQRRFGGGGGGGGGRPAAGGEAGPQKKQYSAAEKAAYGELAKPPAQPDFGEALGLLRESNRGLQQQLGELREAARQAGVNIPGG